MSPFQVLMREWSKLAPYNFIHALRFDGVAQLARWREAIAEASRPLGFGTPQTAQTTAEITAHVETELNRAFSPGESPLRFGIINDRSGYWLTVTFDHWAADDYACRALLECIVSRYQLAPAPKTPLRSASTSMPWRQWVQSPFVFRRQAADLRCAYRVPLRDPLDFRVQTFHRELPPESLSQIRVFAKRHDATVHDVFLGVTAQASGRVFSDGLVPPRDCVGIASAMNIRRFSKSEVSEGFGLSLSQYTVAERRPHEVDLQALVQRIADKTRGAKATASHAAVFGPALFLWRLSFSRWVRATTFHRGAPLVAGISNVDLSGSWAERAGICEYRRIGPAGPPVPFVLMITTFRGLIGVQATYRNTAFSRPAAESLMEDIAERLSLV